MTLIELQICVEDQSANEFDDVSVFLNVLNIIIRDINLNNSAKFKTIEPTIEDLGQNITELTGIPEIYDSILITGVTWKLQEKEYESNWTGYHAEYIELRNRYKHLVPKEYMLSNYNDIVGVNTGNFWDIW